MICAKKVTKLPPLMVCTLECNDFEIFFRKIEKNNADMDVTCKFNTYLENFEILRSQGEADLLKILCKTPFKCISSTSN